MNRTLTVITVTPALILVTAAVLAVVQVVMHLLMNRVGA